MAQLEPRSTLSREKGSTFLRLLALVGVVSPILCVLVFTFAGFLRPGYSAIHQVISDLGVGPNAWILNTDLIVSGLLLLTFAIGLYHWMRPVIDAKWLITGTILLGLSGAGVMNEGLFPETLPGDPSAHLHSMLHGIGLSVLFYALIIALLIIGWQLWKTPAWHRYGWYSVITAFVTFGLLAIPHQIAANYQIAGLIERVQVVEAFSWSVIMGSRLFTLERTRSKREEEE